MRPRRRSDEGERASVERRRAAGFVPHGDEGHSWQVVRGNGCHAAGATVRAQRKRLFKLLMSPLTGGNLSPNQRLWAVVQFRGEGREQRGDAESAGESPSGPS